MVFEQIKVMVGEERLVAGLGRSEDTLVVYLLEYLGHLFVPWVKLVLQIQGLLGDLLPLF